MNHQVHQYKNNGYNIVLDVNSGAVHVVDDVVYDVLALYETCSKQEIADRLKDTYPVHEVAEAYEEITELKHAGELFTEDEYQQSMSAERKVVVPKSMIFRGYTVCKCCGKKQNWKRLEWEFSSIQKAKNKKNREELKQLPPTESNIEKICKWFQLSYSVSSNAVFVRTAFSRWIVYLQEDKVKELFHENYRTNKSQYFKKQKMKSTEGYHKQKLPSENFFEVLQYIKYHDAGTVKRMSKKSRLEKLLEIVEMELKVKNTEGKDYGYDNMPKLRRTNIG